MESLNDLLQWLEQQGVLLFDRRLPFSNPKTKATTIHLKGTDTWGMFFDHSRIETLAEEKTSVLHESGHYSTGAIHEVFSPFDLVEKHEYKADKWAVQRALSVEELDEAF